MIVKLLTEHHYEFLSLKGGCRGKRRLQRLVRIYTCQNVKLLEISCGDSFYLRRERVKYAKFTVYSYCIPYPQPSLEVLLYLLRRIFIPSFGTYGRSFLTESNKILFYSIYLEIQKKPFILITKNLLKGFLTEKLEPLCSATDM